MSVYDKELGGWTEKARELGDDIEKDVKETVLKHFKEGMTIEEICYITNEIIQKVLLLEQIKTRVKK